jgi:hypothetical protein
VSLKIDFENVKYEFFEKVAETACPAKTDRSLRRIRTPTTPRAPHGRRTLCEEALKRI